MILVKEVNLLHFSVSNGASNGGKGSPATAANKYKSSDHRAVSGVGRGGTTGGNFLTLQTGMITKELFLSKLGVSCNISKVPPKALALLFSVVPPDS